MFLRILLITVAAFVIQVAAGAAVDRGPVVHGEADATYGVPPHTVNLRASVAGPAIDFGKRDLLSWCEDKQNETTTEDDGATIRMVGNAAKMVEVNYQVTPDTIVEFDFRCDVMGEVHAIGFDNGTELNDASAQRLFVLYGTEWPTLANRTYRHYNPDTYRERWMRFRIPVGRVYHGRFKYLVFMNDHDVDQPTADGRFRNVSICEGSSTAAGQRIRWDLGDGTNVSDVWQVKHTYRKAGGYVVAVTVTDAQGRRAVRKVQVRAKQPRDVRRTLFIDDQDIESLQNATRVVNRALKHPENPIIVGDQPWGAYRPQVYGAILHDKQRDVLRMWYLSIPSHVLSPDPEPFVNGFKRIGHTTLVAYAESKDGYDWHKPSLGIVDFNGSKDNGLVNMGRDNTEGVSIVYQPDDPNPQRRYKALFWEHRVEPKGGPTGREVLSQDPRHDGMWVSFSPDGLHWTDYENIPITTNGSDTGQCVLYDPRLKKYILYSRLHVGRRILRCTSDDFIHWSEPRLVFDADEHDPPGTQVYGAGFCIYEDHYIGLPWMFYAATNQEIDVQLIHSRDGIEWHRTAGRELVLPNGPAGAWDSGIIFTASHPVVLDDRILIYYFGIQGDHHGHSQRDWKESQKYYRGGIGVATLRRDGWVSLDLPFTGGHVITKPITIPEAAQDDDTPRLILNTNAYTGDVKVTLLDENDRPVPGFGNSDNLHGDFFRAEVA